MLVDEQVEVRCTVVAVLMAPGDDVADADGGAGGVVGGADDED